MHTKKILLLGSTGMAGHIVYYYLKSLNKYNIINASYRTKLTEDSFIINLKNISDLEKLVMFSNPDYIINCVGILIKGSRDIENAVFINAYLPHLLAKMADQVNAKLIHLSTDCVFSGKKGNYKEDSLKDAGDIYGQSKSLGEIFEGNHLTIRTSIVGPELKQNGEGLLHWFMLSSGEVTGYTNAIWGGITTLELAKAIESYLSNGDISGVVHLTNGKQINKYELLKLFKLFSKKENIIIKEGRGIKNVNKSLAKSKVLKYEVPTYSDMVRDQFLWMSQHKDLYTFYDF